MVGKPLLKGRNCMDYLKTVGTAEHSIQDLHSWTKDET
jgi:hypothetical protein